LGGISYNAQVATQWVALDERLRVNETGNVFPKEDEMATSDDLKRYLKNWQEEVDSAAQYHTLAKCETSPQLSQVYTNLAICEEKHAAFWENFLQKAGVKVPPRKTSWRAKVLIWFAKRFGPQMILSTIAKNEKTNRNNYAPQKETEGTQMVAEEHMHDMLLGEMLNTMKQGAAGSELARIEGRHKGVGGNALRAAVLGANDGLCSNLCLVLGVAGAAVDNHILLLTGFAGLMAGAFSMALGEWLSVTNSRELIESEIQEEADELEHNPEGEAGELQLIYEAKGLKPKEAKELAQHMISDKSRAMDALTREELGIDPEEKGGSAYEAAAVSFCLFAVGAIIPVIPFLLLSGQMAIVSSVVLSGLALFGFGAFSTVFTGRSVWFAGLRQLILGLLAAGLTFYVGHLLGVSLT
jgi:vacuolar iron transporter family protein